MRKEYVKPIMQGEYFAANEYVSACWYGQCNVSGKVYVDSNGNRKYDDGVDSYKYTNDACKEQFEITGIDNGFDEAGQLVNAFVVGEHSKWVQTGYVEIFGHKVPTGEWVTETEVTPVYHFGTQHVSTIDSIQKDKQRPNHS